MNCNKCILCQSDCKGFLDSSKTLNLRIFVNTLKIKIYGGRDCAAPKNNYRSDLFKIRS